MKKVLIPLADGFEDIEAVSIIDVLRRGGIEVVTASISGDVSVRSAHGIVMNADALFADVMDDVYDALVLPGGGEGTQNLRNCEVLHERLRRQKEDGGLVCAICAAPTVLEMAGVLDDEDVTCYPSCAPDMARRVQSVKVVADGQIITGQGPAAATLFALVILSHLESERLAHSVANSMLTEFA